MVVEDWSGRIQRATDEVSLTQCRRLAALLDLDHSELGPGSPLPFPWSAILFGELAPQRELGPDGHAARGEFLPPVPLPRRRFAGRHLTLHEPLAIGDRVERLSTIAEVTPKTGRSGQMVFVTVEHRVSGPRGLALIERQKIVYLEEAGPDQAPPAPPPAAEAMPEPAWQTSLTIDPVMLFRYSALTYNAHRIHFDRDYAREVEGYPGLVVNGGLTGLLLLEGARANLSRRVTGYEIRAIKPLFEGRPLRLCGAETPEGALLWAEDADGLPAMRIAVTAA